MAMAATSPFVCKIAIATLFVMTACQVNPWVQLGLQWLFFSCEFWAHVEAVF